MHTLVIFTLLAMLDPTTSNAASCGGAAPAITTAIVKNVTPQGGLNHYQFAITIVNNGSAQASNTLQSVDVYQNQQKLDAKSVPPLAAGQSYTVTYVSDRSRQAGDGTSKLTFKLDVHQSATQTCNLANDTASVTF